MFLILEPAMLLEACKPGSLARMDSTTRMSVSISGSVSVSRIPVWVLGNLVSETGSGIGFETFGLRKNFRYQCQKIWSQETKVLVSEKRVGFSFGDFCLVTQWVLFGVPISGPQLSPLFVSK